MKAIVLNENSKLSFCDIEEPKPLSNHGIVELKAAALNHRDNWITKGLYPGIKSNTALGSDGVGIFENREVIINPSINWGDKQEHQSKEFEILGLPRNGTFAEKIIVPLENICLLYTSPSPRDQRGSRMPSSA